ncbi:hypothetical protein KXD40_007081 [Peronospora effusa]|nr:hypothetical protein KXD40_007081 [Peronospora effusa]
MNIVEAQELMYPAFRLKLPTFINTTMRTMWLSKGLHLDRMRVSEDQSWADYPIFRGQNMVFLNAVYRGNPPPDFWSDVACMERNVSHMQFLHDLNESEQTTEPIVDTLVIATSPDSWSFQHFIDRVAVVWSQAQLVIPTIKKKDTVILSGRLPENSIVNDIYAVMVGQHLHDVELVYAKRLVFSCRAPLIHPFTTQRITENILQTLPASTDKKSERNIILFLSRTKGGEALNGGRKILNEPELFNAISAMLNTTGRPEKLQYFQHDEFDGLVDVAVFMRDRVKMMIGPHGAAFYNSRFAQPRTAIIEIIPDPDKFFRPCFWEQARQLGQDYSAHVGMIMTKKKDMVVEDIQEVTRLVQNRLMYVDNSYQFEDALMQQQQRRTKIQGLSWLQVLLGGFVLFSILMLTLLYTELPLHRALLRSPVKDNVNLFTLVQQRRKMTSISKSAELLNVDDLVHSDSYKHWAPAIIDKCMHGMEKGAAPCIKEANSMNIVEAQELMYPAFRLKLPTFINTTMRTMWLSKGLHLDRMRVSEDQSWADYPIFRGQNMVFLNAVYRGNPPPDFWSDVACMERNVSHMQFLHDLNESEQTTEPIVDTLVIATSPDSWSFQHFIDRVAVVWSQAQLVIPTIKKKDTVILSGRLPKNSIVNDIYAVMVGQHLHDVELVYAKRLVFSCRAPLIHPFTTQRITENILQTLPASTDKKSERNIILFLSRTKGGEALNGGRKILNEPELFNAISAMLNTTGRPEKLQYFQHDEFDGLVDVAVFMRDRVKMMIGPHGAAFYNSRFAQPRTAIIEIIPDPDKFFRPCFWEQARQLGQDYSAHVGMIMTKKKDMVVEDIQEVTRLVQNRLMYVDNSYQFEDALQQQRRTKIQGLSWLQVLLGGFVLFSILMLTLLYTELPLHRALLRSPVKDNVNLFTLVQQRRKMTSISKSAELLNVDDLVHSDSYKHWAPAIIDKCMHGMEKGAAPCIKEANSMNIVEAQELMYPAFRLKLPTFINTTMRTMWLSKGLHLDRMRVSEDQSWADYPIFRGQNMVFLNAVYRGNPPPDFWSDVACMERNVSHMQFLHDLNESEQTTEPIVDTLVIATSPDSWSFQHFIDRVAVVWSQAQLVIPTIKKKDTVILSGRLPKNSIVNDIYAVMVGQHLHDVELVYAKRLVFSCRAPLIHPFTTQRITENILQTLPASTDKKSERNIILFLSRTKGGEALNGGRKILNEPELFNAISAMLNTTGRPEKLQYFQHDEFDGLVDVAVFMRDRVKMMIGPHGAAFYNSRFAQPRTAIIEIIPDPDKFFRPCFWEQARQLGQDYSAHVGMIMTKKKDMVVEDIQEVTRLVQNRLMYVDNSYQFEDALVHKHTWNIDA